MFLHFIHAYGSWCLAPFGLAGMWAAGKRKAWGWALSLLTQALWAVYAIVTGQYGFLVGTLSYAFVYLRNFLINRSKTETTKGETCTLCGATS